ncbi:DUF3095 domain-containing protein [Pseudoalteromonas tunicata]|uniref:DUF3095 domain-containing protein n=1 Tax=Pseudoalteromonas tunicata TaxID=314281 RepID=UPI00273F8023|nr:DUF3095 domain-containing protein [Pseudoalteromonas tunicata]MDP5212917.1 DUF3095 domain-containing protein [Pseudoalteromonas tunicata]
MTLLPNFYQQLKSFKLFDEFTDSQHYHPLPDEWFVVVADVENSTQAIKQGRYKEVNALGVMTIVALINTLKEFDIPYVFGGDGSTACIPKHHYEETCQALAACQVLAKEQFKLTLRIGLVSITEIRANQCDVWVAKYQPHPDFKQAMFKGAGLAFAEQCVKNSATDNPYLIKALASKNNSLFDGFECRWNEIPSPHQHNVSLLVQTLSTHEPEKEQIYKEVISHINSIYGNWQQYHPLQENLLSLTASVKLLSIESKIRNYLQSRWQMMKYLARLQVLRIVGMWVMARNVQTTQTNWGAYKQNLVLNSDFQKFDEILRMVISGTKEQYQQLRILLESYHQQGKIVFGLHISQHSLITCIVTDYNKNHTHFLDGSNGGYALAALEMKAQLKKINAP